MSLDDLKCICPKTSGILDAHQKPFVAPGITVVALVRERSKFRPLFQRLVELRKTFVPYNYRIHITLHAVQGGTSKPHPEGVVSVFPNIMRQF